MTSRGGRGALTSALGRWLMGWYYMRLLIRVTPRQIHWWEGGDFSTPANSIMEVSYVA